MKKMLTVVPQMEGGVLVSSRMHNSHTNKPLIIEAIAAKEVAFFQYNPAVSGVNKDTNVKAEAIAASS